MQKLSEKICFLIVVFLCTVPSGCNSPKLEPIRDGGSILAFGDSLTLGNGASVENSYPSVLQELTGLNIINSGVSGETTDDGLKRFESEIERIVPDLIILIEGGNDILQNRSHEQIKQNIESMIQVALDREIPVVLMGIPEKNLFSNSASFYQELAEEYQLVFDGELISDLQRSLTLKSDHVHFNKKGYRKMAESIYELLRESGAL